MSSAIEVLKDRLENVVFLLNECPELNGSIHHKNLLEWKDALEKALLALEQKKSLKSWIEEQIKVCDKRIADSYFKIGITDLEFEFRKITLEQVLERVGEKK